ncbi:MAG: uncharacterized protein JWL76_1441 [Thermoleophilia bacterium]|nr:uncharacterized protein [Thermoleophilia bacterium]
MRPPFRTKHAPELVVVFAVLLAALLGIAAPAHADDILGPVTTFSLGSQDDFARSQPILSDKMTTKLEEAGADSERFFLQWNVIAAGCGGKNIVERADPENGCYNWSAPDRGVQAALGGAELGRKEKTLVMSTRGVPCFIYRGPATGENCAAADPYSSVWDPYVGPPNDRTKFNDEFIAFMKAAMIRYRGSARGGSHPFVANWTIFNEPNGAKYWYEAPLVGVAPNQTRGANTTLANRACHYGQLYSETIGALQGTTAPDGNKILTGTHRIALGPLTPGLVRPVGHVDYNAALKYLNLMLDQKCVTTSRVDAVAINAYPGDNHPFIGEDTVEVYRSGRISIVNLEEFRLGTGLTKATGHELKENCEPNPCRLIGSDDLTLKGIDSLDADFGVTRGKPIWIPEVRYQHEPYSASGGLDRYRKAELGQATWLPAAIHKAALYNVTFVSWYPFFSEDDGAGFDGAGLNDHVVNENAPYQTPDESQAGRRKPSFVAFQSPVSIRALPTTRKAGGRDARVYEVVSYYHGSTPTISTTALPVISTECSHAGQKSSWALHNWRGITNSPGLEYDINPSPARGTMRRAYIWGDVLVKVPWNQRFKPGITVDKKYKRAYKQVPMEKQSFCMTQRVPKGSGVAAGAVLHVQGFTRTLSKVSCIPKPAKPGEPAAPYKCDAWMPTHYRTYYAVAGSQSTGAVGDYLDDPRGRVITPGPDRVWPRPPLNALFAMPFSISASVTDPSDADDQDVLNLWQSEAPVAAASFHGDDEVSLSVAEVTGAQFIHPDVVVDPPVEPEGEELGLPESTLPFVWYNPRQAGSFRVSLDDPADSWTEARFSELTTSGWSDAGHNNGPDDEPGFYASIDDQGVAEQTYSFATNSAAPEPILVDAHADGDWDTTLSLSVEPDDTAPTGGSITAPRFENEPVVVSVAPGTDADSGVASWRLERSELRFDGEVDEGNPSRDHPARCLEQIAAWQQVGPERLTEFSDTQVANHRCYQYRLVVVDNVGNESVVSAPTTMVDMTAPDTGGFTVATRDRFLGQSWALLRFQRGSDTNGDPAELGVGIAQRRVWRRSTAFKSDQTCATSEWSSWTLIVPNLTNGDDSSNGWQYTNAGLLDATCYQYRLEQVDRTGNSSDPAGAGSHNGREFQQPIMKVDLQLPRFSPALYAVSANDPRVSGSGFGVVIVRTNAGAVSLDLDEATPSTLYARSGIRSVTTPSLPSPFLMNNAPSPDAGAWGPGRTSWGEGSYRTRYVIPAGTKTNRYGNSDVVVTSFAEVDDTSPAGFHYVRNGSQVRAEIDNDKPTNLYLAVSPEVTQGGHQLTHTTPQDAWLWDTWIERRYSPGTSATATASTAACSGAWSEWTRIGNDSSVPMYDPWVPGRAEGCYDYRFVATDRPGNRSEYQIAKPVWDDRTSPTATIDPVPQWVSTARVDLRISASDIGAGLSVVRITKRKGTPFGDGICIGGTWSILTPDAGLHKQFVAPVAISDTALVDNACYEYRVDAVDRAGNASEPMSSGVVQTGFTAPAATLTLSAGANPTRQMISGRSIVVNPSADAGSFNVNVALLSTLNIASVTFPSIQTVGNGSWAPTTTSTTNPYRASYTWTANAPLNKTQTVASRTRSGLTTNSTFDVTVDTQGPTGGSLSYAALGGPTLRASVTIGAGLDVGTGTVTRVLNRATATISNGTCGAFGALVEIARNPASPYTDNSIPAGRCVRYSLDLVDGVQNKTTIQPTAVLAPSGVGVDTTPPTAFTATADLVTLPAVTDGSAAPICATIPAIGTDPLRVNWSTATDAQSGIASYDLTLDNTTVSSSTASATFTTYMPAGTVVDGTHSLRVIARNGGGLTTTATPNPITVVRDRMAPSVTLIAPTGPMVRTPVAVQWTASDDRCFARVQIAIDGIVQTTTTAANSTRSLSAGGGSHVISVTAIDSAGNRTSTQRTVEVDTAPPSIGPARFTAASGADLQHVIGSTLYFNPNAPGSVDVAFDASDDTGVNSVTFPDIDGAPGNGWTPAGSTIATGGPTYTQRYAWTTNAIAIGGALSAIATDAVGQTATSTFQARADATAPTNGSITYEDGPTNGTDLTISTTSGTDDGSGLRTGSARIETAEASLNNGTCGSFGAFGSPTLVSASPTSVTLGAEGCYRYQLANADNVGNEQTVESTRLVQVDRTAPTGTLAVEGMASPHVSGTASDTATVVASISVVYSGPASGTLCEPAATASWVCDWSTSTLPVGTYVITATLTDAAGNTTALTTTHVQTPATPVIAPSVTLVRASTGIVAKWTPTADATSYRWLCENVTRNTSLSGSTTFTSQSGLAIHTPACSGNGSNPAGTTIRFTVWPVNVYGEGPASIPQTLVVDSRPTVSGVVATGFNLDNSSIAWRISKSGPATVNGTPNHDMYARVQDLDGDLYALSSPDPDLGAVQDAAAAGDRARFIFRVAPTNAARPQAASAHLVMQLGPDDGERLVRLVEGVPPTGLESAALSGSDGDTCAPGQAKTLTGTHWTLDCSRLVLSRPSSAPSAVDMRIPLRPRVGARGEHLLPDQNYQVSGYARDARQPADNRFLTHSNAASTEYPAATPSTISSVIAADRIDPSGEISPTVTGNNGARKISATINATTTLPSPATNPSTYDGSPVASVAITIDRTSANPVERLVTNAAASCPTAVTATCSYVSPVLLPDSTYEVTARITDQAGNVATTAAAAITIAAETSSGGGFLNPSFGDAGLAITDIGAGGGDVTHNFLASNGNIITVGTRIGSTFREIALTSHTPSGVRDATFGVDGISIAATEDLTGDAGAIDDAGRILVAGSAQYGNWLRLKVTRFNPNGSVDTSFGTTGTIAHLIGPGTFPQPVQVKDMIIDDHGRVVIAGTQSIAQNEFVLVRLTPNGELDATFGTNGSRTWRPEGNVEGNANLTQLLDGTYALGGNIYSTTRSPQGRYVVVAKFSDTGTQDMTFGTNGYYIGRPENQGGVARRLIPEADGSITVGLYPDSGTGLGIARLTPSGQLDTTFGTGNDGATYRAVDLTLAREFDLVKTSDEQYVAVGRSGNDNNNPDKIAIARFHTDGLVDTTFGNNGVNETSTPQGAIRTVSAVQLVQGDVVVAGTLIPTSGNRKFLLAGYLN